ncbi:hypothetical protein QWY87_12880, partial [Lutimonas halocynthiae]|nr:hypothetical protein [Lutimonas halocynthiae]
MSNEMKTPGVYIRELDAFGNAVVPVPTAVPAFIGYTQKTTDKKGKGLINKAKKINSLAEFMSIYEDPNPLSRPKIQFRVKGLDSPPIDFQSAKLFVVSEALKINEMGAEGDYYLDTRIPKLYGPKKAPELTSVTVETLIEFSSKKDDDAIGSYSIDLNSKTMFGPKKDPSKWGESFEVNIVPKEPDVKDMTNGSYYYIQDDKKLIGPVDITLWPEL